MAVRVADNLKTANDSTEFPVAFGNVVWLNKDKSGATEDYSDLQTMYNNDELGNGGSAIQVDLLPHPSADELGKIYEFIGSTGTYVNGYFYECVSDEQNPPTYSWVQKNVQPNAESFTFNEDDFNIDSSTDEVSLLPSRRVFNGSKADWDLLSVAEKTQYGATAFTDDEGGDSCPRFPNYANQITIPDGTTSWTATEDCYVIIAQIFTQGAVPIKIDNVTVGVSDTSAGLTINNFSGYLKKGQTISYEYLAHAGFTKIFPLL